MTRYNKLKAKEEPSFKAKATMMNKRLQALTQDAERMKYLVHCMRVRTFGPHHYVILLHEMASAV